MRTVDYSAVLRGTAALAGMGAADIGTAEFALLRTFHDRRLQEAWERHTWPDLCRVEQRAFRPQWLSGHSYVAGDERYDVATGGYYQCVQATASEAPTVLGEENSGYWAACATSYAALDWAASTAYETGDQVRNAADGTYYQCIEDHTSGGTLAGDAAHWGALAVFERYIGPEQFEDDGTARTVIGDFLRAYDGNPRVTTKLVEHEFTVTEQGAVFTRLRHDVTLVWVNFRVRRPELIGDPWDTAATYAAGDQVYYAGATGLAAGNFYTALKSTVGEAPAATPGSWALVEIPYIFRGWLIQAGYADWLTSDGQGDKGMAAEGMATGWLELEADKLQRQGAQVQRIRWVN